MPANEPAVKDTDDATDRFAILTYHIVGDEPKRQYATSGRDFTRQLSYLKAEGYIAENLELLEQRLRGRSPFPSRYVVITLDDGHESSMYAADVLAAMGCGATFCVIRDRSQGREGYIRPADIRELRKGGFSIASHGVSHRRLTRIPRSECLHELWGSKEWLEDLLGGEVRHFAAPGGDFDSRVTELAFRVGYTLFGTCTEDMNRASRLRLPGLLNRINVRAHFSMEDFRSIVEGRRLFYWKRQARAAVLTIPKLCLRGGA